MEMKIIFYKIKQNMNYFISEMQNKHNMLLALKINDFKDQKDITCSKSKKVM